MSMDFSRVEAAQDARLDRIESKLDKLSDAMSEVIRVEEKIVAQDSRLNRIEWRLDNVETMYYAMKDEKTRRQGVLSAIERFSWLTIAAIAAWVSRRF